MRKINLIRKKMIAAGILCIMIISGTGTAFAAEKKAADQTESEAAVTADGAEAIALADAGIKESGTKRLYTKADRENGETVYEVTFIADSTEYEYKIRKADGKILEWEIDGKDIGDAAAEKSIQTDSGETKNSEAAENSETKTDTQQSGDDLIGLENAKSIALKDAGLKVKNVTFSTIKFEEGRRDTVYEIEFYQGRNEFEYTIDAYSGEILEIECD